MKIANILAIPAIFALGTQAITLAQCRRACKGGTESMNRFCRKIPEPRLRAGCWGLTLALGTELGQTACANWCYWQYSSRKAKRDVLDILEGRDEISLASDFTSTGINLDADIEGDDVEISWTA